MWIVGLSRFVIVVVLRPLLQDEPELQPNEEGLDLFSEPEERKKSRAGRGSVCNLARQSH